MSATPISSYDGVPVELRSAQVRLTADRVRRWEFESAVVRPARL